MSFKTILLIVMFATAFRTNAQHYELGKVTISELAEKQHPKDPSATAAILFEKGKVQFRDIPDVGYVTVLTVTKRIKIYKKEGYDYASATIPYYYGNKAREKIILTGAATYNLVNGKIEKTKLTGEGEFDEKTDKYWAKRKISFPNLKEGSVIEYEYTLTSPQIGKFRDWDFQGPIPVNYSEFKTYIPDNFTYNINIRGFVLPKVVSNISAHMADFIEVRTTYLAENMPAMSEELYVNNIRNYTTGISHELSMTKSYQGFVKNYSADWESVSTSIYKEDDFGKELLKTNYFEKDIDTLIDKLKTENERILAIFNFVKARVHWNDKDGYTCDEGVKSAYANQTGNVAEINLMLTAMLRYAGIDAYPIVISTRSHGIALFPNLTAYNYVIAGIKTKKELQLLDATEKLAAPGILPFRDLNWFGRLIKNDGTSEQVDMIPKNSSKEIIFMNAVLKQDGEAEGMIKRQLTDYKALQFRYKFSETTESSYVEEMENRYNAIDIGGYKCENNSNTTKPIVETYTFKDAKDTEVIDGKIYFSPLFFLSEKVNPFKMETRLYPVDFGFPFENKYNISIEIPDGYVVESLPQPISLLAGDDIGTFKYSIANTNNIIQVAITGTIKMPLVVKESYGILKEFYQKMIDKQNEKIILKKI